MSDKNEPSYYEIALTNRQVLVSFVILLACVLAAFLSGVWLGREGTIPASPGEEPTVEAGAEAGGLEQLEEFRLLSERRENGDPSVGREPKELPAEPKPATTLAQDVGSSPPSPHGSQEPPRGSQTPSRRPSSDPPPSTRRQSPPPARQPDPQPPARRPDPPPPTITTATETVKEEFVIQVLSTRDETRAKRVLAQLRRGGYQAFMSPVQVGTQINYRVRIGPFSKRPPAEKAAREVNSKYKLDTWITAASN